MSTAIDLEVSPTLATLVVVVWILLVASLLWAPIGQVRLPGARSVGALTYPLYLLHAALGYMVMSFFIDSENRYWIYAITFVGLLVLAEVTNRVASRPFWRPFFAATVGRSVRLLERSSSTMPSSHDKSDEASGTEAVTT